MYRDGETGYDVGREDLEANKERKITHERMEDLVVLRLTGPSGYFPQQP